MGLPAKLDPPAPRSEAGTGPSSQARVRLRKFPYPYVAAATVASDIDNATYNRFTAVHSLFCGSDLIRPGTVEWNTLGLTADSAWYDPSAGGVPGLGLDLADSFFLIADNVSMGMYAFDASRGAFREGVSDGHNTLGATRDWIRQGRMDTYHGFMHYRREQVLPLLEEFHRWCESEGVAKPCVWINHSMPVCPTGICPASYRPNWPYTVARQIARAALGPLWGLKPRLILWRPRWYYGATPGSPYYINDALRANGLRYVWLGAKDELANVISLPERRYGEQSSILEPVTMDDGIPYYRFLRCYGRTRAPRGVTVALRTSPIAFDASTLFTDENLRRLCRDQGTCILYTHWTLARSLPVQDETIANFHRLRSVRDQGLVWVAPLSRVLEWTRLRTFLKYSSRVESGCLVIDVEAVDDPVFGRAALSPDQCRGLSFDLPRATGPVAVRLAGRALPPGTVQRQGDVCWIR